MKIRFLNFISDDAYMQMAIDEAILISISEGKSFDTLRFYEFNPTSITYGFSQTINNFDVDKLKKDNVNIVKRMSGGTSVLHKKDFTYSLALKEEALPRQIVDAYKYLSQGLINGLNLMGVNASFREDTSKTREGVCYLNNNPYDIVVNDKKISGNAQFRKDGVALQHGTIILENNTKELCDYLIMDSATYEKSIKSINQKVTSVDAVLGYVPHNEKVRSSMEEGFIKLFENEGREIIFEGLSDYEKQLAKNLYENKYKTNKWNN